MALAQQERTGKRLGETIVECGFVSSPELSNALASQYGIELTTETGFGTGLRSQIQRRHESERRDARPPILHSVPADDDEFAFDPESQLEEPEIPSAEASLLSQLEEQWAKLAAAEAVLADQQNELETVTAQRDRRHEQATRLARRARSRSDSLAQDEHDPELQEHAVRLEHELHRRDEEIEGLRHETQEAAGRLATAEASLAERERQADELRSRVDELAGELQASGHERELAVGALGAAQAASGEQDRRLEELGQELERAVHSRTEVEAAIAAAHETLGERKRELERLHRKHGRRREQAARLAARLRQRRQHEVNVDELGAELERAVQARTELEAALAAVQATVEDRDRSLGAAHGELERVRGELDHVKGELGQVHEALAATHATADERERALEGLRHELDRRRDQAARFARRLRSRRDAAEEQRLAEELERLHAELERSREELAAAQESAAKRKQRLQDVRAELEQAHTDLAAAHGTVEERERSLQDELGQLRNELEHANHVRAKAQESVAKRERRLDDLRGELERANAAVAAARGTVEEREQALQGELGQLRGELDRRRAQTVRFTDRLLRLRRADEEQLSQIERLVADVRGCDEEIARLRHDGERVANELRARHERARAQTRRFLERLRRREHELAELAALREEPTPAPEPTSHLVFVELPDRYELVVRAGPPPPRNSSLELPELDLPLVVAGARRSPLPDDERPCVVAQAALGVAEK